MLIIINFIATHSPPKVIIISRGVLHSTFLLPKVILWYISLVPQTEKRGYLDVNFNASVFIRANHMYLFSYMYMASNSNLDQNLI